MTHPVLLRLSLLSLVLIPPGLAAAAPPATPPATVPAASAEQQQTEAEKQEKANAEKQKKDAAEKQKKIDIEKQKQTVVGIRRLGTALYSWLTDQLEATVAEQEAEKQAGNGNEETPPPGNAEDTQAKTHDIQANPLTSRDDLEEFLVPEYIAAIPETDGWGNPYEVRINTDNLMAKTVISIRSPGRKGYYSGDVYKVEPFNPAEVDQDIVWADGYFVRWPESGAPKPLPAPPPVHQ